MDKKQLTIQYENDLNVNEILWWHYCFWRIIYFGLQLISIPTQKKDDIEEKTKTLWTLSSDANQ